MACSTGVKILHASASSSMRTKLIWLPQKTSRISRSYASGIFNPCSPTEIWNIWPIIIIYWIRTVCSTKKHTDNEHINSKKNEPNLRHIKTLQTVYNWTICTKHDLTVRLIVDNPSLTSFSPYLAASPSIPAFYILPSVHVLKFAMRYYNTLKLTKEHQLSFLNQKRQGRRLTKTI